MTSGGTFNTYNFRNGGQGSDNGNTLVIFNTPDAVILDKTSDGRQFGPSVLAPFSKVTLKGDADFEIITNMSTLTSPRTFTIRDVTAEPSGSE